MKYTQLFIQTFKENPNDAQLVSHQLLHRAGFTVSLVQVYIIILH